MDAPPFRRTRSARGARGALWQRSLVAAAPLGLIEGVVRQEGSGDRPVRLEIAGGPPSGWVELLVDGLPRASTHLDALGAGIADIDIEAERLVGATLVVRSAGGVLLRSSQTRTGEVAP